MFNNALLMAAASAAASVPGRYVVNYSCRFNAADSAYMQRTFGAGNDEKFTVSFWWKKGIIDQDVTFLNAENSGSDRWRFDTAAENLQIYAPVSGNTTSLITNPVFRDPSGWYHTVLVWDLSLLEGSRVQIYTNGMKTDLDVTTAPVNTSTYPINTAIAHEIGAREGTSIFFDGYLSQYCFIDNAALTPADFGEFDENGVWRPIDITGLDYSGTNSFLLDFADSSDLGNDVSGNNNDWTVSGITSADQVTDTPTDNFPTLTNVTGVTYTEARTQVQSVATTAWRSIPATIRIPLTGKWCWEWTASSNGVIQFGAVGDTMPLKDTWGLATFANISDNFIDYYVGYGESQKEVDGTATQSSGLDSLSDGDKLQLLLDQDAGTAKYYSEGVLQITHTGLNKMAFAAIMVYGNGYGTPHGRVDYGQDGFTKIDDDYAYLSTANFPEVTAPNSKKYFDAVLYQGNGLSQRIGQFQPIEEDYSVGNSALWVAADSTFLFRTPSSAGNRKTGSLSLWCKRGSTGSIMQLYNSGAGNDITFNASDKLTFADTSGVSYITTQIFTDTTQWNHFLFAWNTTLATAGDRLRIYHNGVEITAFDTETNPSLGDEFGISNTVRQTIGANESDGEEYDGYLSEIYFVDSLQLTPSDFGSVDSTTNRWIPKEYTITSTGSDITFTATGSAVDATGATAYTSSSVNIGTVTANRKVVIAVSANYSGTKTVSTMTVGGESAYYLSRFANGGRITEIWAIDDPDQSLGTSEDIVTTWSGATVGQGLCTFDVKNSDSYVYDSFTSTADPLTGTVSVPAGGMSIGTFGVGIGADPATGFTFTSGLTSRFNLKVEASEYFAAGADVQSTATDQTPVVNIDGSPVEANGQCISLSPTGGIGRNGFYLNFSETSNMGFDAAGSAISSTTYRYLKLDVTGVAGSTTYVSVGELELYAGLVKNPTSTMTGNSAPSPLVASASEDTGTGAELAFKAFDDNINTHWQTANGTVTGWVKIDLGSGNGIAPGKIGLGTAETPDRTPSTFTIQGSNNDSDYTTLATYTSAFSTAPAARVKFYLPLSNGGNNWISSAGFSPSTAAYTFYDTPTRNFATFDPGFLPNGTLTLGNLLVTAASSSNTAARVGNPFGLTSGKYYWEFLMPNGSTNQRQLHIIQNDVVLATDTWIDDRVGTFSGYESHEGQALSSGDPTSTAAEKEDYGDTWTSGDVISCAVDLDIGAIWWGKNGTWQNSASEAEIEAGNSSKAAQTGLSNSGAWFPAAQTTDPSWSIHMNCGQHIYFDSTALTLDTNAGGYFRHAVPDGFKAIHVDNLTESDSFVSAFSWIKNRDATDAHLIFDRVRGVGKYWVTDTHGVETTDIDTLQRFLKQGATIGDDVQVNTASESYAYWDWFMETAGSGSANEEGSINTSATLVDTTSGISVSKFTGNATGGATIGHGLGVVPKFMIVKSLTGGHNNIVYFSALGAHFGTYMDLANAPYDLAIYWNDVEPTSSLITLGTGNTNTSGVEMMMYAFAEIEGFSSFGGYTGNGNAFGPVIHTGFAPAWLMIKKTSGTGGWVIYDSARSPFNDVENQLLADTTAAETTGSEEVDFLANGFKVRTGDSDVNTSTGTYAFAAFAQNPFGGSSTTPGTAF